MFMASKVIRRRIFVNTETLLLLKIRCRMVLQ